MAITGASRKQAGLYYDKGGAVTHVEHPDFGAVGDYDPATGLGTDTTTALQAAFAAGGSITLGQNKKYRITGLLDLSAVKVLHANGSSIHRTDLTEEQAGEIMSSVGTVGTYRNLTADVPKGTNVLVNATLAGEVTQGDIVKITADQLFVTSGGSGLFQGEMRTVRKVSGSNVYLNEPVRDTYTTANTVRAAKVSYTTLSIVGTLHLWRHTTDVTLDLYGIRFENAAHVRGEIVCHNCQERGVAVNSCYDVKLGVRAFNSDAGTGSLGYGLSINDSSTNCEFDVFVGAAKHAVAMGGSPANRGVPWDITVSGTGTAGDGSEIFDAHNEVGSVTWLNCTAIAGSWDDGSGVITSAYVGINSGARYNRIINFTAIGCSTPIKTRIGGATCKEFYIKDVHCIDCTGNGFWHADAEATIEKLTIDGIRGTIGSGANPNNAVKIAGSVLGDRFEMSNVRLDRGGLLSVSAGLTSFPAVVDIIDCSTTDPVPATSTENVNWKCIQIGSSLITEVNIVHTKVRKQGYGIYVESGVTLAVLRFIDSFFDQNHLHARFGATAAINKIVSRGSSFLGDKSTASPHGVMYHPADGDIVALMEIDGTTVDTSPYFLRGTATKILLGTNNFPALSTPFALSRALSSGWLEILAGSLNTPRLVRGAGTPNAVVSAPKGAIFQRSDGAAGTLLYVNTDGATAWTAYA